MRRALAPLALLASGVALAVVFGLALLADPRSPDVLAFMGGTLIGAGAALAGVVALARR